MSQTHPRWGTLVILPDDHRDRFYEGRPEDAEWREQIIERYAQSFGPHNEDEADPSPGGPKSLNSLSREELTSELQALADPDNPGEHPEQAAEKRLVAGVTQARAGCGGTIPPVEHRFRPGQSGNPSGGSRRPLIKILRQYLDAEGQKRSKDLVRAWFSLACTGNRTALKELIDRMEGPPPKTQADGTAQTEFDCREQTRVPE